MSNDEKKLEARLRSMLEGGRHDGLALASDLAFAFALVDEVRRELAQCDTGRRNAVESVMAANVRLDEMKAQLETMRSEKESARALASALVEADDDRGERAIRVEKALEAYGGLVAQRDALQAEVVGLRRELALMASESASVALKRTPLAEAILDAEKRGREQERRDIVSFVRCIPVFARPAFTPESVADAIERALWLDR